MVERTLSRGSPGAEPLPSARAASRFRGGTIAMSGAPSDAPASPLLAATICAQQSPLSLSPQCITTNISCILSDIPSDWWEMAIFEAQPENGHLLAGCK